MPNHQSSTRVLSRGVIAAATLAATTGLLIAAAPAQAATHAPSVAAPAATQTAAYATSAVTHIPGRLVPIMQSTTGYYATTNCGPTALTMALVAKGIAPAHWPNTVAAVQSVRATAMHKVGEGGTSLQQLEAGFTYYGKSSHIAGINEAIAWAQKGHAVIVGGNERYSGFNWAKWLKPGSAPVGHYVFLAGYDPHRGFKVLDPDSAAGANVVHYVSAAALRGFSAYYAYPSNVIPAL